MSAVPSIVLVDLVSNEKHRINSSDSILGRNWLQCDDKRISRNHGILKILSDTLVSVQATHQNPIFYRKKDDTQIQPIQQNQEVTLNVGDTFGLLVDTFWFRVQKMDESTEPGMNGGSTNKRRTSSTSEPDSTNKKVKTEPDEFQSNGDEPSNGDTTMVMANDDDDANAAVTNTVADIDGATNSQLPSTSSAPSADQNGTCQCSQTRIKTEPIDLDENEAQPMQTTDHVVIKVEPDIGQNCCHCSSHVPIKTEVKEEPANDGDGEATSSNEALASGGDQAEALPDNNQPNDGQTANPQAQQPTRRDCCRYGIRCYRRNPAHRSEQAHPGDTDYRLPDYPDPPLGTPQCPFLDRCYRRHPLHFQQFSHKANLRPGDDKKKAGYEATATEPNQTANRPNHANNREGGNGDDDEEEDPFHTDDDSDPDYDGYSSPDSDDMPGFRNM